LASAANLYQLNRAIQSGVEKGEFLLPKGPSGKVKLSAGAKATAAKEVRRTLFIFYSCC
jgi:histone H1/5